MKVRVSDLGLINAVAQKTGGDSHEILRRGFMLAGPDDAGPDHDPECLFDLIGQGPLVPGHAGDVDESGGQIGRIGAKVKHN
jgi:hypothetical protein